MKLFEKKEKVVLTDEEKAALKVAKKEKRKEVAKKAAKIGGCAVAFGAGALAVLAAILMESPEAIAPEGTDPVGDETSSAEAEE